MEAMLKPPMQMMAIMTSMKDGMQGGGNSNPGKKQDEEEKCHKCHC